MKTQVMSNVDKKMLKKMVKERVGELKEKIIREHKVYWKLVNEIREVCESYEDKLYCEDICSALHRVKWHLQNDFVELKCQKAEK